MTSGERTTVPAAIIGLVLVVAAVLPGCGTDVDPFPVPGGVTESVALTRTSEQGIIIVSFSSYPFRPDAPPDGVRAAVMQALGRRPCSAASFYWTDRPAALKWIREQAAMRRWLGRPPRVVLAGHGLGATEASETAKEIMARDEDIEIVLLLTVDAVKTGKIGSAAGVTATATVGRLPGINASFTAYDGAPAPDGRRLWTHINYYQTSSALYSGSAMPFAENHHLDDWTGMLNHGNSDDFAKPLLVADLRAAIAGGSR